MQLGKLFKLICQVEPLATSHRDHICCEADETMIFDRPKPAGVCTRGVYP